MCNPLKQLQEQIPQVPLDGVAVALLVYTMSPPKDKLRNTLLVGGVHYFIHEMICKPCESCK
jgi:hypothetical protein